MSWFSKYIADPVEDAASSVGNAVSSFFKGPDLTPVYNTLAQQQQTLQQSIQQQTDATNQALALQQQAQQEAVAAAVPQQDSESSRIAAEDTMRKLQAGSSGFTPGITNLGAPPVGYRTLTGT